MKKNELVAQLEAAKALTSVVSIDNVIKLILSLEEEKKGFSLKPSQFEMLMDKIQEAVDNIDRRNVIDKDSAEFELDWNNCISLNDVGVDYDFIYNEIRESLEELVDFTDDEDEEAEETDGFIAAQIEAEQLAEGTLRDIDPANDDPQ
jgi:hypothetical protein